MADFVVGWPKVQGSEAISARFGGWPSFHDAEVRRITLDCTAPDVAPMLELTVYVFQTLRGVDDRGYLVRCNETLLTLRFTRVTALKLDDFNHQNQIAGLALSDIDARQWEWSKFEVRVMGEFGVSASFYCHEISVAAIQPVAHTPPDQARSG